MRQPYIESATAFSDIFILRARSWKRDGGRLWELKLSTPQLDRCSRSAEAAFAATITDLLQNSNALIHLIKNN